MANDTRSIADKLRETESVDDGDRGSSATRTEERGKGRSSERNRGTSGPKDFVKDRDTGDEDRTGSSER